MKQVLSLVLRTAGVAPVAGDLLTYQGSNQIEWLSPTVLGGSIDHGTLAGRADDDHPGHPWLLGRAGGQVLIGGTASGDDLELQATSHATKGIIDIQADLKTDRWLDSSTNLFIGEGVVGAGTLAHAAGLEGWYNVAIGGKAAYSITDAEGVVAIGFDAAYNGTTAGINVAIGYKALQHNVTGENNICIGANAGSGVTGNSHSWNLFIGGSCGFVVTTGTYNAGLGYLAMFDLSSGDFNLAVGAYTGVYNQTGDYNTMVGYGAGLGVSGNSHTGNTFVGCLTGYSVTTGGSNTAVGYIAGYSLTTGVSNVFIGANAGSLVTTASNKLYIDNTNTATPLVYGEFDNDFVNINNQLGVGLGATAPATSAIVELSSTTGALLLTRMTTTQRNALTAVNGMVIYNTTTGVVEAYEGGAWVNL
jgi:hypothetical protein